VKLVTQLRLGVTVRRLIAMSCLCSSSFGVHAAAMEGPPSIANPASQPESFIRTPERDSAVHLLIGHSTSIGTRHRLTRVYVTNPSVLNAYPASPNQVLVTSLQPGLSSLILWDENSESKSYLFSSDINVEALENSIRHALPHEEIHVEGVEGRVLLSGTVSDKAVSDEAEKLAGLYSKDVSNALVVSSSTSKQVRLKVRIVEVDRTKLNQFGFNFFSAGGNNLAQTSTNQFPSSLSVSTSGGGSGSSGGTSSTVGNKTVSISNPLNFLFYNAQLNVGAMLQDLEMKNVLQILAEPNITTISGKKANFLAGGEFPFPVVQGGVGGLTSITIQFRPYGVKIEFTPEVNADGTIQLKVAPEVSALDYTNAVQISGYTIPALSTRRAETQVVLQNEQSFAISGLLDKRTTDQLGRTPGIANIPILGQLFKSKSTNHSTSELIVLVTPEIVDPLSSKVSIEEPKTALPLLEPEKFDSTLPKPKEKQPESKP